MQARNAAAGFATAARLTSPGGMLGDDGVPPGKTDGLPVEVGVGAGGGAKSPFLVTEKLKEPEEVSVELT